MLFNSTALNMFLEIKEDGALSTALKMFLEIREDGALSTALWL